MFDIIPLWLILAGALALGTVILGQRRPIDSKEISEARKPRKAKESDDAIEWEVAKRFLEADEEGLKSDSGSPESAPDTLAWPSTSLAGNTAGDWVRSREECLNWSIYQRCKPWRGRAILVASGLIQIVVAFGLVRILLLDLPGRLALIVTCLGVAGVGYIVAEGGRMARPHYAPVELRRLLRSTARPVLFLRGFETDSEALWHELPEVTSARVGRWSHWTVEDIVGQQVRRVRPFVGLSLTGDELPRSGASRLYLAQGMDWKRAVMELAELADLVILRVSADSPAVLWEACHCLGKHQAKTVLLTVDDEGRPRSGGDYNRLRAALVDKLPDPLPMLRGSTWYVGSNEGGDWMTIDSGNVSHHGNDMGISALRAATNHLIRSRFARTSMRLTDPYLPLDYALLKYFVVFMLGSLLVIMVVPG